MEDFAEDNFYYLEKVKIRGEYHVVLYKALMGKWEARETFLSSLRDGLINRMLVLGIEENGQRIPIFQCAEGEFFIPEIKNKDKLGKHAETLLIELGSRFGIKDKGENQGLQVSDIASTQREDYDILIVETLSKVVTVRAKSMESALSEAHDNYSEAKSGYVLDSHDFQKVNLSMRGIHQEKQRGIGGR